MFLLDTMVLSELIKPPRRQNPAAAGWIRSTAPADLFISVITIAEIERGVERQRAVDPPFARRLEAWIEETLRAYEGRLLPVTVSIARRWGRLAQRIGNKSLDLAIAATALDHGLTVATRNVAHFTPTGAATVDPFTA